MEMRYRLAKTGGLDEICRLAGRVIDGMEADKIFQWDESSDGERLVNLFH